jgi:hypothetical protein
MTHDELLTKFTDYELHFDQVRDEEKVFAILRAVVELHKPTDRYFPNRVWGSDGEIDTGGVTRSTCKCGSSSYPCDTIQAIEKELNNGI